MRVNQKSINLAAVIPDVITDMEMGFHFEEGGCYAFAEALAEHLQSQDVDCKVGLTESCFAHAFVVLADGTCIDHAGAAKSPDDFSILALDTFKSSMFTASEVESESRRYIEHLMDKQMAIDVIMEATVRIQAEQTKPSQAQTM